MSLHNSFHFEARIAAYTHHFCRWVTFLKDEQNFSFMAGQLPLLLPSMLRPACNRCTMVVLPLFGGKNWNCNGAIRPEGKGQRKLWEKWAKKATVHKDENIADTPEGRHLITLLLVMLIISSNDFPIIIQYTSENKKKYIKKIIPIDISQYFYPEWHSRHVWHLCV